MTASQTNFSQLKDFLAYLATIKGDLSNITAPPFLLSPTSATEIPASWASRHDLFLQPAQEANAAQRALLILKNFLCSLQHQLHQTFANDGPRKPINAVLGELFIGEFSGADGSSTRMISEQVSHHPPVTASALYNPENEMSSTGYAAQETSFHAATGCVRVQQTGHAIVRDEKHGESHLRTLPSMTIKGLLTGHPHPELEGVCYISSSSGYLSTVEFTGKTWAGGARNSVRAELKSVRDGGKVFEVTGQWSGRLAIRDCATDTLIDEFDVAEVPTSEIRVPPLETQSPWESQRAWQGVAGGIREGDMRRVSAEKKEIEEAQREIRSAQEMAHVEWPTVFFHAAAESREFEVLARAIPDPAVRDLARDRTAGAWAFVGVEAAEALISEGVYHRSLEPTGQILHGASS
ncbi:hypothetical protein E0Z10_g5399 [Xylaria hypoxylon]|uniref:Oxysterol-binding protein n=1 Tax=Xylaria hypoxylon TaxID=37992 RepID=A0A4Z0YY20_9PEZI|nr:hypothetical protein E0Z10_g5399 [Xylaria hypoxylon]